MLPVNPGSVQPIRSRQEWRFYIWINGTKVWFPGVPGKSATQVKQIMRETVVALLPIFNED